MKLNSDLAFTIAIIFLSLTVILISIAEHNGCVKVNGSKYNWDTGKCENDLAYTLFKH